MVDILMATYNGAKYVESQIHSLQAQTFKNWVLYVHDDGSTDNTVELVKTMANLDSRILVIDDNKTFGNPAENFLHLINFSFSEFIMFCDQDDVWFDNKIEMMVNEIRQKDNTKPHTIYTNSLIWKPNIGIFGKSTITFPKNLQSFLFLNSGMQGCVSIFNYNMRELIKLHSGKACTMHDHLLHFLSLTIGELTYVDISLMLYRIHDKSVTGDTDYSLFSVDKFAKRRKIPVINISHYNSIQAYYGTYSILMNDNNKRIINEYIEMLNRNTFQRIVCIIRDRFKLFNSTLYLLVKVFSRPFVNVDEL